MRSFLKSLDECIWHSIEKGWKWPTTLVDMLSKEELNDYNWNSKRLNVMFIVVSQEEFKRISLCKIVKET